MAARRFHVSYRDNSDLPDAIESCNDGLQKATLPFLATYLQALVPFSTLGG